MQGKRTVIAVKLFLHERTSRFNTICPRLFTCVYRPKETGYYCSEKINIGKYNINLVDISTDLGETYSSTYIKERDSLKRCVLSLSNTAVTLIKFLPSNLWEFWHGHAGMNLHYDIPLIITSDQKQLASSLVERMKPNSINNNHY